MNLLQATRDGLKSLSRKLLPAQQETQAEPGKPNLWPAPDDLVRRRRYQRGYELFDGQHQKLFEPKRDVAEHGPYVVCNACKAVSRVLSDRMCLEAPVITVGEDEALNEAIAMVLADSHWGRMLLRAFRGWSYRGDLVLKALARTDPLTEEKQVVIREVLPQRFFPLWDPEDDEHMLAASLCWEFPASEPEPGGRIREWWQREEWHMPGLIQNRLYRLRADESFGERYTREEVPLTEVEAFAAVPQEVETGIDEIPLVHIPNNEVAEELPWGQSDYADIEPQQQTINERATDHRHMLRKWADPVIGGISDSYFDENRNFNAYDYKALPSYEGEPLPQFIRVPLENYPHSDAEADKALQRLLWTVGVSPESVGISQGSYPESGRAIRLRQADTLSTVTRKWVVAEPGVKQAVVLALKLLRAYAGGPGAPDPEDVQVDRSEGLVQDERERLEELALKQQLGLSAEQLLREMYPDWDDEAVEAELERRKAARPDFGMPAAATRNAEPRVEERTRELAGEPPEEG